MEVTFAVPGYGDGFDVPRVVLSVLVVYVAIGDALAAV
jgi:hypothetical protein